MCRKAFAVSHVFYVYRMVDIAIDAAFCENVSQQYFSVSHDIIFVVCWLLIVWL